jgi:DNA-binding IclR family transcriptional regulator
VTKQAYPGTQAVLRAITLLKAFTDEQSSWKLSDLARHVDLNKTTTFRILTALESEGLITRDANDEAYRLGPAALTLGGRALRANSLRTVARPFLERMAAETQETAALETLSGIEVLIIDEVLGTHVMTGTQSIGTRWPAYATSTGKALLAALPADEVARRLAGRLTAWTPHTITALPALQADLASTRRRGYAVAREELEVGLVAVGAPVRDYDGRCVGAVSLAGPSQRLTSERTPAFGARVVAAALAIARQLGYPPERGAHPYETEMAPGAPPTTECS